MEDTVTMSSVHRLKFAQSPWQELVVRIYQCFLIVIADVGNTGLYSASSSPVPSTLKFINSLPTLVEALGFPSTELKLNGNSVKHFFCHKGGISAGWQ